MIMVLVLITVGLASFTGGYLLAKHSFKNNTSNNTIHKSMTLEEYVSKLGGNVK